MGHDHATGVLGKVSWETEDGLDKIKKSLSLLGLRFDPDIAAAFGKAFDTAATIDDLREAIDTIIGKAESFGTLASRRADSVRL